MLLSLKNYFLCFSLFGLNKFNKNFSYPSFSQSYAQFYKRADFKRGYIIQRRFIQRHLSSIFFSPFFIKGLIVQACFDEYHSLGYVSFQNRVLFKLYIKLCKARSLNKAAPRLKKSLVIIAPTLNAEDLFKENAKKINFDPTKFEIARLNTSSKYDASLDSHPTTLTFYNKQTVESLSIKDPNFCTTARHIFIKKRHSLFESPDTLRKKKVYKTSKFAKPLVSEYNLLPLMLLSLVGFKFDKIYTFGFDMQLQVIRSQGYSTGSASGSAPLVKSDYQAIFIRASLQHDPSEQFMLLYLLYRFGYFSPDLILKDILDSGILSYSEKISAIYSSSS